MDHIANVGFVDAHAEGVGGHHHLDFVPGKLFLSGPAVLSFHSGVVRGSGKTFLLQPSGDVVHLGTGGAVNDPGDLPPGIEQLFQFLPLMGRAADFKI